MADGGRSAGASFIAAVTVTITLAVAAFALLAAVTLLLVHPTGSGGVASQVIRQNQGAKTVLYVLTLIGVMPLALVAGPRIADAIASGPSGHAADVVAALLAAGLAAVLVAVRISASLPWGDGLGVVLTGVAIWAALALAVLILAARRAWPAPPRLLTAQRWVAALLGAVLVGAVLSFTALRSLSGRGLAAGLALAAVALAAARFVPRRRLGRVPAIMLDLAMVALLLLVVPNVVVFHPSPGPPNAFFVPGIIQFHQDFLLGPTNQLLGGGALMVNVPVSQYGVGYIYALAAWFHLVPIGYGTYGFLDGLVTALFYVAGYAVLRFAGAARPLAVGTMALAVVALVLNLFYPVGSLPQQGPLRFGLPIAVIVSAAAATRWPHRAGIARAATLLTLGAAAIWSLEMLAYTLFVYGAVLLARAWLLEPAERRPWLLRQIAAGVAACVVAHLALAGATLAGTGHLPDWGQYLAYVDALVLGGQKAGGISYGFADFSPGLVLGAAALASGAALVLLMRRVPAVARREPVSVVALAGVTAYAIALLSYSDNRSSTYLLGYVGLPTLLAAALWLGVLLRARPERAAPARLGALAFSLAVAAIMLGAAWPRVHTDFSDTALAHLGGLGSSISRLWHPPPIDPRAPRGAALLRRYAPARRALILLPDAADLGTEILIRTRRANRLSIGDPKADAFVDSSIWTGELSAQLRRLRPGTRFLTDRAGLRVAAALRQRPGRYPLDHPSAAVNPQTGWILQRLAWRFVLRPLHVDRSGLMVAVLEPRRGH